ncbi:hypothetical protein GF337_05510, partial [candidate division KSB1 bacterium]|nr:hypothetical protein [candidate division KSB1 bacterium]
YSVDGVGDVNGDAIPDFVIGARGSKKVYLFFGRRNVDWGRNFSLGNADVTFYSTQWNDWTGWRSVGAGDVNGDGLNDILIGAPKHNQDGGDAGKAFLIFGRRSGWRGDLDEADASFYGEADNDQAGWDVQGAGDVNGDGYDDFVIGAWYNDQNGEDAGKMYLIEGKSSGWSRDVKLSAIDKYFLGEYAGDYAGFSAATAGDVNGDGVNDIVTSSTYYSRSYSWGGKISLFLGEPSTNLQPELSVSSNQLDFGDDITSSTLTVTNSGNGILEWDCSLQNNSSWITSISPSNGNLGAGMSEVVSINIDRGQLSAGFYNDSLMVSSNGGNALVEIYANVPILNELTTSTTVLDYGSTYTNRDILLRNTGNTTLNWSIANTTNISWISSISPNQGILSHNDSITVSVEVNRAGLPAGEYFGNLQLSSEAGTIDFSLKLKVYTTNTLYVRNIKDSPNAWDGKENVYVSINEALEAATLGDHIWVAQGEYYESVQLKHGIKLFGGFSGTETSPDERVDLLHNHHYHTIVNSQNVDRCILTASDNVVDGFKLINGYAYRGGGVSIYENSNIELRNLFITECEAEHTGGGIDILAYSGSILIENIIIWKCISICGALEISDLSTAETTVRNCTIVDNDSYGLEVPYHSDIAPGTRNHDFYNCIVWENNNSRAPSLYSDVWAWARDFTDYSYIGYDEWNAVSGKWGPPLPNNIFEMNVGGPDFMDAVNGDFRLSPTSPCIGRGRNNEDMGAIPFDGEALSILSITPISLQFQGIEGQTNPISQMLSVKSSTGDTILFTIEEVPEMDWLNLSAASGSTEDQIEVSVDISGLSADTYSGSIRFTNGTVLN